MKRFLVLTFFIMALLWSVEVVKGSITDVYTEPMEPTDVEVITIVVSGIHGSGGILVEDSDFRMEDTSLELDIFFMLGPYGWIRPWSHSEVIGTLPANFYDLTVREYTYSQLTKTYELSDTYLTGFTVVPEPATLLLLTVGAVWIRAGKRRT
jgi:hypothetical protein